MDEEKKAKFGALFAEFVSAYLSSPEGADHVAAYPEIRIGAQKNFDDISRTAAGGQDITQEVILKLLPYSDTAPNRKKGAWIHIAPAITADLVSWFENAGWTSHEDWPQIAKAILAFVQRCTARPTELGAACSEFASLPYSKGFQSGMLSPILNALKPDSFLLINKKSRLTINHFAATAFALSLLDYPKANDAGFKLLSEVESIVRPFATPQLRAADIFDVFSHWLVAIKEYDFGTTAYWKISPGENASLWAACSQGNYISIGWSELGDIANLTHAEFAERRDSLLPLHPDWNKVSLEQVWTFAHIEEGDRVVANKGTSEVVGIGAVTGPYYYVASQKHGHRLPVTWDDKTTRRIDQPGWRRTVIKLDEKTFQAIAKAPAVGPQDKGPAFSPKAFELLAGLHQDPIYGFYSGHKEEFADHLEAPFQRLFANVAVRLSERLRDYLETESNLFGRIRKNDYGKGGAWDYYWGAFYPKGESRKDSAQLFVWMNWEHLRYGFYIGDAADEEAKRFAKRSNENAVALAGVLSEPLASLGVEYGVRADQAASNSKTAMTLETWLKDPAKGENSAAVNLSKEEVLQIPAEELSSSIALAFEALFPFVRLATSDSPLADIIEVEKLGPAEGLPVYSLEQLAKETGLDRSVLEGWVRAIERKKQAIVYGPPGTGKTYTAERLARHIAGGTQGFIETVQFHPAYSYEDFIEGIRPKVVGTSNATPDGKLVYVPTPGRFLDFCERALTAGGTCVLIIDEINRANLARVLGELMYLLEYRREKIPLSSGKRFGIPENVRVIGTMNTADRSIALVDHALRRRFAFLALRPNFDVLRTYHASGGFPVDELIETLKSLNQAIGDTDYEIGITYFLDQDLTLNLPDIWQMEIEPYLEEYFFDRKDQVANFRWEKVKQRIGV